MGRKLQEHEIRQARRQRVREDEWHSLKHSSGDRAGRRMAWRARVRERLARTQSKF